MKNEQSEPTFLLKLCDAYVIISIICFLLYSGCAAISVKPISMRYVQGFNETDWPDKQVKERFRQYWSNRFAGIIDGGYDMEAPHFREVVEFGKYRNYVQHAANNKLLNMEIHRIYKDSDHMVRIQCLAKIQIGAGEVVEVEMMDRWVRTNENWYHLIKDPLIFSL